MNRIAEDNFRLPSDREVRQLIVEAQLRRAEALIDTAAAAWGFVRGAVTGVIALLRDWADNFENARQATDLYQHLARLSEAELSALGITRSQIADVVAEKHFRTEDAAAEPVEVLSRPAPAAVRPAPRPVHAEPEKVAA